MKNGKKRSICYLVIIMITTMILIPFSVNSQVIDLMYPANKNENTAEISSFINSVDPSVYTFSDATILIQKKILYKNVESEIKNEMGKYATKFTSLNKYPHSNVHPERQIYLFLAVSDEKDSVSTKYAIFDAQTGRILTKGSNRQIKQ
ncbi:hypothetical protein QFZ81_003972 [Paenibacillus sp. V4I9]|uniref:hypothetical protein n=1 Tax=Paenibacillus sp. V4I9 TaxID=3042308 RepID=UPI0027815900|nr:hypothetical protein [Paenibacillus sp. V4I9]MDQ0888884.1 hypothetical protein [Paenibacillus sp. V4I9]